IEAIFERRPRQGIVKDVLVIRPRHFRRQLTGRHSIIRNKGRPEKNKDRQNNRQEKYECRDPKRKPFPRAEIDDPRPVALAGYGCKAFFLTRDLSIDEQAGRAEYYERYRIGAR